MKTKDEILSEAGFGMAISGVFKSRNPSMMHVRMALMGGWVFAMIALGAVSWAATHKHPVQSQAVSGGALVHK